MMSERYIYLVWNMYKRLLLYMLVPKWRGGCLHSWLYCIVFWRENLSTESEVGKEDGGWKTGWLAGAPGYMEYFNM